MSRVVQCVVLNREAEGLATPPYPGKIGTRIYDEVSRDGWRKWLERATMIINENGLSTADPRSVEVLEQHMVGFLFNEGEMGGLPEGFQAGGSKK